MAKILRLVFLFLASGFALVAVVLLVSLLLGRSVNIMMPGLGLLVAGPALILGTALVFMAGTVMLYLCARRLPQ